MTDDTWVSLALLAVCAWAGWLFFRWDHRMILRDREALESCTAQTRGLTVSDNLRHRIAYALAQADGDEPGMEPAECDFEMADAVIAALKLHVVTVGDFQTVIKGSYPKPLEESTEDVTAGE